MTERELGDALLAGEHPIDVRKLTQNVLRRDRRRTWILGTLCVIAWMLVVMLPWSTVMPMMAKVGSHLSAIDQGSASAQPENDLAEIVRVGTMATFFGSIASMLMAAICTVAFVSFSRRATLRQVNARLGEISEQLKLLAAR